VVLNVNDDDDGDSHQSWPIYVCSGLPAMEHSDGHKLGRGGSNGAVTNTA